MISDEVSQVVEKHGDRRGALIAVLEDIQQKYGYLSAETLQAVAEKTRRSLVDIYSVATFYRAFSLQPRGKHLVSACVGTACHVRGAPGIVEELKRRLGVSPGATTTDREFTLETVNCLGACALGPIVVVDGHYNSKVGVPKVEPILNKARIGLSAEDVLHDDRIFPVTVQCPRCGHSLMDQSHPVDGHPSIRLRASGNGHDGWINLSRMYGSSNATVDERFPEATITHFRCPNCEHDLASPVHCFECDAPMVPLGVEGGGVVQFCSRRGCPGHSLDLSAALTH
jgi:NADH-quinone oxidoreductase subunit E